MVELRYNAGHENRGSLLVAKASWEDAKLEIEKSENMKRQNSLALSKLLGMSQNEDLRVIGKVPVSLPSTEKSEEIKLENYVRETPEFQLALQKEKSSQANVALTHSAFYPNLNLSGGITQEKKEWEDKTRGWSVALSLSVPLFSGMKDYYASKAAYENLASSRIQVKSTYDDLYIKFRQTLDA